MDFLDLIMIDIIFSCKAIECLFFGGKFQSAPSTVPVLTVDSYLLNVCLFSCVPEKDNFEYRRVNSSY